MRAGVIEGEVILGYVFDRGEFGSRVTRENRLMVAVCGLLHFLANRDRIDEVRFKGTFVPDEFVGSDEWTASVLPTEL